MAKQSRRSVSVSGELYDALKALAEKTGGSQSGLVEDTMREALGLEPRKGAKPVNGNAKPALDKEARLELLKKVARERPAPAAPITDATGIFTF